MSETLEILKAARELIAEPEHWTRETFAKNESGFEVDAKSKAAVCFCAVGAIFHVAGDNFDATFRARQRLYWTLPPREMITDFNDNHTHAEVLNLFDKAIASLSTAEVSA